MAGEFPFPSGRRAARARPCDSAAVQLPGQKSDKCALVPTKQQLESGKITALLEPQLERLIVDLGIHVTTE